MGVPGLLPRLGAAIRVFAACRINPLTLLLSGQGGRLPACLPARLMHVARFWLQTDADADAEMQLQITAGQQQIRHPGKINRANLIIKTSACKRCQAGRQQAGSNFIFHTDNAD